MEIKRIGGKVSAGTFLSKVLLEGPIKKAKDENDGTASSFFGKKTPTSTRLQKSIYKICLMTDRHILSMIFMEKW